MLVSALNEHPLLCIWGLRPHASYIWLTLICQVGSHVHAFFFGLIGDTGNSGTSHLLDDGRSGKNSLSHLVTILSE